MDIDEQTCPNCGLPKSAWSGDDGEGYTQEDVTYCCSGCAEGTGCTCTAV